MTDDLASRVADYLRNGPSGMKANERRRAELDLAVLLPHALAIADSCAQSDEEPLDPELEDDWEPTDEDMPQSWGVEVGDFLLGPFYGRHARSVGRVALWLILQALQDHALFTRRVNRLDAAVRSASMRLALAAHELELAFEEERRARQFRRRLQGEYVTAIGHA
ncbi:hypothetical protein LJR090_001806 [Bosea sp. LjRoot90]|uniref:hypothetical protein n=1 Tax=Bosea sp. LjRoot90 TaxID=3342342 RepID=UPI003ECF62F8